MILKLFSVFDVKADNYSPPFAAPTVGHALRSFQQLAEDKNGLPGKYPGDFKLCEIGSYNDVTGNLQSLEHPISLGFASDFLALTPTNPASTPVARLHEVPPNGRS